MWPSVFRAATGRLRGPAALAAIFAAYGALAVAAAWPLAARSSDHLFGVGTPPLNVWAMDFVVHQIARAPLRLFDGNAFYPYAGTLAFSEHLFVPALLSAPFIWATGNPVLVREAPNGVYTVKVSVLKALGDQSNPAHWETWTSPVITLARP